MQDVCEKETQSGRSRAEGLDDGDEETTRKHGGSGNHRRDRELGNSTQSMARGASIGETSAKEQHSPAGKELQGLGGSQREGTGRENGSEGRSIGDEASKGDSRDEEELPERVVRCAVDGKSFDVGAGKETKKARCVFCDPCDGNERTARSKKVGAQQESGDLKETDQGSRNNRIPNLSCEKSLLFVCGWRWEGFLEQEDACNLETR